MRCIVHLHRMYMVMILEKDKKVSYQVLMSPELRASFIQTCKDQDTEGSREVRAFIRAYIQKHGQQKLI